MPALPKIRIDALAELARHLRFESPEAARRQLERAEALNLEILAECAPTSGAARTGRVAARGYPPEYVAFRITGLRVDSPTDRAAPAEPVVLTGEALLADLPALIERLSAAAQLTLGDLPEPQTAAGRPGGGAAPRPRPARGGSARARPAVGPARGVLFGPWLTLADLAARWKVGPKTIERWRRLGLMARRVRTGGAGRGAAARQRLVFSTTAVLSFEAAGGAAPAGRASAASRAARTPRLTARERVRLIARARRYHGRFGWSLNRCAARLAAATGRAQETVRRALLAHDAAAAQPIFDERPPLDDHARAVLERSKRAGASPTQLARRVSRARTTVYRVAVERRAERLGALDLDAPVGPMFDRPDAGEVLLAPPAVRTGLGDGAPATIGELVAFCDAMDPPAASVEAARAVAYAFLRHRARAHLRALPRHGPAAAALDQIETDLRWAGRLKAELVRSQLPIVLRSIRARLEGRGPESLAPRGPTGGPALIDACVTALVGAIDRFDPFRALAGGGRLAAPAAIAVNRALTRWLQAAEEARRGVGGAGGGAGSAARAAHKSEAATLIDWTLHADPWQEWLEPPEPLVRSLRAARADPPATAAGSGSSDTRLLQTRFGFGPEGAPPMTLADAARSLGLAAQRVAARERRAIAAAIAGPHNTPRRAPRARTRGGERA